MEDPATISLAPSGETEGQADARAPQPGEVFEGKYRIERELGSGGMGVVMAATHVHLGEPVALKFLRAGAVGSEEACRRFIREAQATVRIKSRHVVRVLDVGTAAGGAPFIVMERLLGRDLAAVLRERGKVPAPEAAAWVRDACSAMAAAHALGIVHRDLKPSNLFLADEGQGEARIKVLDFGIAKILEEHDARVTAAGAAVGTPRYMSPEQLRSAGAVDARTDVWSLGVILHELLTGRSPFESDTPQALGAHIARDPPIPLRHHLPDAPVALEALLAACLEKDPDRRTRSAAELGRALDSFARRPARAFPRSAVIAGLVVALGGAVAAVAWLASAKGPSREATAVAAPPAPSPTTATEVAVPRPAVPAPTAAPETGATLQRPAISPPRRQPAHPAPPAMTAARPPDPPPATAAPAPPPAPRPTVDPMGDRW